MDGSSVNPYSRFLRGRVQRRRAEAAALLDAWDRLETLVIGVYRLGRAGEAEELELRAIRAWMQANYRRYAAELEPHWRAVQAGGEPMQVDPFRALWETPAAARWVGDWSSMQRLPAAREALNRWLLALGEGGGSG